MASVHKLTGDPPQPIGAHAWSGDRSFLALTPNNEDVEIFQSKAGAFTKVQTLSEHSQRVCGIDWAPKTNQIVTCAQDRNAYVWKLDGGVWKPTLVLLRINRAATCVKWSPDETKFAVGSGARLISICYFEVDNDWWVSKHIKKPIRSTVLSVDWHPNSILVAAGSTDFKARIFSGYIKEIDKKPTATVWGKKMSLGDLMGEWGTGVGGGGWVHDVSFSASGDQLAYVSHDSAITVVDGANNLAVYRVELQDLPFRSLTWVTPSSIVAAGFDYVPILFTFTGSELKRVGKIDIAEKKAAKTITARDTFRAKEREGQEASDSASAVQSTHQNVIGQLAIHTGDKSGVKTLSSVAMDGNLVLWDLAACASAAGVTIA